MFRVSGRNMAGTQGCLRGLLRGQGVGLVLGEPLVLQDRRHVVVAGDEPGRLPVGQGDAVDRGLGPQAGVERERVRLVLRAGDVRARGPSPVPVSQDSNPAIRERP